MRIYAILSLMLIGCAAAPGERLDADEAVTKQEALVGATCTDDSGCDAWEFCNTIICVRPPCLAGTCRDVSAWSDTGLPAPIPDNDATGLVRTVTVDRPASNVASVFLSLNLEHTWRGDLRISLRSPAGTDHVVHDRAGGNADNLTLGLDLTSIFEGETAVGDWTLTVSDNAAADVGRLLSWSVRLEYAAPAPAPTGRNVWAQVEAPSIESAHSYENDTDQTWDLRPFSAGATRARIRFARLDTERNYDFVEVVDMQTGVVLDRFTGNLGAFTTREYDTGDLGIRLSSDYSVTGYGFAMQYVEVFGLGCLDDGDCPDGTQCPNELVRCIRFPCFLTCQPVSPGGEGDGCMGDSGCEEDLYCGSDGFCHADGTCRDGDFADCHLPGNSWPRLRCLGHGSCTAAGMCSWNCGAGPTCEDGDTTVDGCNTCVCRGGLWACTERYCPPVAAEGEACGNGTICDTGLTCDRGRTSGATCSIDQAGTCVAGGSRICTADYSPVCGCNGQTFSNECRRIGVAPFAHEGECALEVAIPDADADGISQTLPVIAPADGLTYTVTVRIDHTYRGDLVVWLTDPDGVRRTLSNREGGAADGFEYTGTFDVGASGGLGNYTLHVSDNATYDLGVLRFFNVQVR